MTAELSRRAIDIGVADVTAIAGKGHVRVNAKGLQSLAQGYTIRALELPEDAEIPVLPYEVVLQVREALLTRAPLLLEV